MRSKRLAIGAGKTLAVAAIVVWSLFPIGFIVLSSFKPGREIFAVPPELFFEPTFEHYASLWQRWPAFFDGLVNSLIAPGQRRLQSWQVCSLVSPTHAIVASVSWKNR
ncbi:hypothetical protein NKI56_05860 [Mesorhizobium sp. M0622]|uniref:hypothetical protein n=1 Tax=unclassified Mesorhizobium TaxID=325217 RepID=UPI00333C9612